MLNFLSQVVHLITGAINDVKNWIIRIIQAVYSFIASEFDALSRELVNVWDKLYAFIASVEQFAVSVYDTVSNAIVKVYHDILQWASDAINFVYTYVKDLYQLVVGWIDEIRSALVKLWDDIVGWVIKEIWDPLYNFVSGAIHWIEHEGSYIWNLITHPELLAKLLGHYLWVSWLGLIRYYGKPIGRWLMHGMFSLSGELADLLETFITSWL